MKHILRRLVPFPLIALLALCLASSVSAQTTLNSTTTTAAINGGPGVSAQQIIPLTSVTGIAVKDVLFMDKEFMYVTAVNTASVTVARGYAGSAALAHVSGVVVWTGPRNRYYANEVIGACTATSEAFLPHIVTTSGNVSWCSNGEWVRYRSEGTRDFQMGRSDGGTTYTASGAITVQPGISFINGTTLAMTLVDPTTEQNGMIMVILATNASAHTVTYTAGFGGGTTARDVCTFGGAINDGLTIIAFNKVWWVISTRNCTLG